MIVDLAVYDKGIRRVGDLDLEQALEAASEPGSFVWIGLHEPSDEEFEAVRREFDLHPLAVEDAITAHQRPKVEVYDDTLLVVLKTARYVDATESVEFAELLVFVGAEFLVSVRHGEASALVEVRAALEDDPEHLAMGPVAALHAIVDRVVEDYLPVVAGIDNDLAEVEVDVFSNERTNPAERIFKLKREVSELRRNTVPLLEGLHQLSGGHLPGTTARMGPYFRDVMDELTKVAGQLDGFRDVLSDALNANLAQISVRQNDDMRTISAWVALAAIPTMIGGIYGMNFDHMPKLDWAFGYPAALLLMAAGIAVVHRRLKRAGWL